MNAKRLRPARLVLLSLLISIPCFGQSALDYSIFGASDVFLNTYSVVHGDVYSGDDLTLKFGYGIQRPLQNVGSMYAFGDYTQESLSQVNGNVRANGFASLLGSAAITGSMVTGSAASVPQIALPPATSFQHGTQNLVLESDHVLAPGAYGDVLCTGLFESLTLSSGDYYFETLRTNSSTTIHLNMTNGPVRIYSTGDIHFSSGLSFTVNGIDVSSESEDLDSSLASQVLFETHGAFQVDSGFLSQFYGTIFAPQGVVDVDLQDMYGSILASGRIDAEVYLEHVPSTLIGMAPAVDYDLNADGTIDALDIDELAAAIRFASGLAKYDLNRDGMVTASDYQAMLADGVQTIPGDANLDRIVDVSDFNAWNQAGSNASAGWANGDFDGSGVVDNDDFLIWNARRFQSAPPPSAATAVSVPEPSIGSAGVFSLLMLGLLIRSRHSG